MKNKSLGLGSIATLIVSFGLILSANADTTGYWRFEDGSNGSEIVTATSEINSSSMDGEQWDSNETNALYSSDVAGAYIYDPVTDEYNSNTGSMLSPGVTNNPSSAIVVHDMSSLTNGSFTVEMFVKVAQDGGAPTFSANAANRVFNLDSDIDVTTKCNMTVGGSSGGSGIVKARLGSYSTDWDKDVTDYSTIMEDGDWHHLAIVATYTGSNTLFKLYGDYVLRGSYTSPDGTYAGKFTCADTNDFRFGTSASDNMSNLDFFFDDVRLSDTALSTNEFLQAVAEPASTTVGYWRLEDGVSGNSIVTTADSSGNGLSASQWAGNETNALYSSNVAATHIYDPLTDTYVSNTLSMHAPASSVNDDCQIHADGAADAITTDSWTYEMFFQISNAIPGTLSSSFARLANIDCAGYAGSAFIALRNDRQELKVSDNNSGLSADFLKWTGNDGEDGDWHHIAMTVSYDSVTTQTTVELFYDYSSEGTLTSTSATGPFNPAYGVRFGVSGGVDGEFDWFFDEARLSEGVLTPDQFLQAITPDTVAPDAPAGLAAEAGNNTVALTWDANAEADLNSYTVYRSTTSGSGYNSLASGLTTNAYADSSAVNGTTYYYVVTATDDSDNESGYSAEASALPVATLGYWRFDDGTPGTEIVTASDSSANGLDGEQWSSNVTNVLYSADVAGEYIYDPVTGQTNANTGSMFATGTETEQNSQIQVGGLSGLVAGSFTLEMFVKAETDGGGATINGTQRMVQFDGSINGSTTSKIEITGNSAGTDTYLKYTIGTTAVQSSYSSAFGDGEWHHVAYVVNYDPETTNSTVTIYRDGVSIASQTATGEFASTGNLRFGISGVYNGMTNVDFLMDDIRLSTAALTTNEFLQVASAPEPVDIPTASASVSGGSSFIMTWEGGGSFTVLTNADLTNPDGWGALTSGASPITNSIGSEAQLFFKLQ